MGRLLKRDFFIYGTLLMLSNSACTSSNFEFLNSGAKQLKGTDVGSLGVNDGTGTEEWPPTPASTSTTSTSIPPSQSNRCSDKVGTPFKEGYVSAVSMHLDHVELVAMDGSIYPTTMSNQPEVELFRLSQDVLGNLNIDRQIISGRWDIKELRIFFRADNNYVFNFNMVPICRYVPSDHTMVGITININAFSMAVAGADKLTFNVGNCDIQLLPDGDCQISKSFEGILKY